MRWRLLFYGSCQIGWYALEFSLLTLLVSLLSKLLFGPLLRDTLLGELLGGPMPSPEQIFWTYLNLLALLGPLAGWQLQRWFHRDEAPMYANQAWGPLQRMLAASLLIWALAGGASLAAQLADGRWRWLSPAEDTALLTGAWHRLLQLAPWLPGTLAGLLGGGVLVWAVIGLSSREEAPEEADASWELRIDSVSQAYGARQVLRGAWLSCRSGEIVGLLGRNGCGKSTLLEILFGQLRADFKALFLNDRPVERLYRLTGLIAYLPQRGCLPPGLRSDQAIRLMAGRRALARLAAEPRLAQLLRTRIGRLSGGERRLLELAVVLALPRAFVLLDEPFSELEPLAKGLAQDWLRQAAAAGTGIIVTDHDYHQILQVSSRVMLMRQGQTRAIAGRQELEGVYLAEA